MYDDNYLLADVILWRHFSKEESMTEELKRKITIHDATVLSDYIHQHRHRILGFIEQQLGSSLRKKVDAEDVYQEVSIEAVRSLEQVQFGDREPIHWLFQIAERKIIDLHRFHFRSQKRSAHREIEIDRPFGEEDGEKGLIQLLVASMTSASQAYSRQVKLGKMEQAIQQLPEDQQKALRLRYVENLPSKKIAEQLGKSDASIRVLLTRALKRLQELLIQE